MLKEKAKSECYAIGTAIVTVALTFAAFAVVVSKTILHRRGNDA